MTTWREQLKQTQLRVNDTGPIIACTLSDSELDTEFDEGFGCEEGQAFTAWSEVYVYFPICYDGSEWAGYAPRNPCDIKRIHQGG